MKRFLFCCIVFLTVNYGCKNNPVGPSAPSLIGTWNWVKSVGGIMGGVFTPQTDKHTRTIIFTANSLYKEYINDSLAISASFTVAQKTMSDSNKVEMISYSLMSPSQIISRLDTDTLILSDYAADGFTSTYNRIK
jgi:hypothetical protein